MPAEMSAERKAIVDDLKDHATRLGNNGFHNAKDVLFAYAKDLEDNIPPAPPERWPRCKCGQELETFSTLEGKPWELACLKCKKSVTGDSIDQCLAAFRAAEQEIGND